MKKYFLLFIVVMAAALLLVTACSKTDAKPVAIDDKTDKCDVCSMAVKDNQFATEIILENGKAMKFDDIGCMNKWMEDNKDQKQSIAYVRDYESKKWVDYKKASFVYDKTIKTPMAYNVISFSNKKDAQTFIDENTGKLLTYEQLQKHTWERNHEMMQMMKQKKMQMENKNGTDMNNSDHSN